MEHTGADGAGLRSAHAGSLYLSLLPSLLQAMRVSTSHGDRIIGILIHRNQVTKPEVALLE